MKDEGNIQYFLIKPCCSFYKSVDFVLSYADWIILLLFFSSMLTGKYLILSILFLGIAENTPSKDSVRIQV